MVTAYDVEANKLIEKAAHRLREMKLHKPAFVGLVKSGAHASRPPQQADFWYFRCASILRQAYVNEVVGTNRLRRHYGGRKRGSVKPEHHAPAGGSTIRKAMQELEKAGLLAKQKTGRVLTAKGRKFLDAVAKEAAPA
jgi:small subunit ribosomal protein S19e